MDLIEPLKAAFHEWRWSAEAQRALRDGFLPEPADLAEVAQRVFDAATPTVIDLRDEKVLDGTRPAAVGSSARCGVAQQGRAPGS